MRASATLGLTPSEPPAEAETATESEAPPGAAAPTPPLAAGDTSALADDYWRSSA